MDTYEKKYNEALERAEIAYKDTDKHIKATIERIFPELRESEDKRIGNVIYCIIRDNKEVKRILEGNGVSVDNALSYIEKQEQKPDIELVQRSWYMEGYHDREFGKEPMWLITACDDGPKYEPNPKYGKKLVEKQKTTWSDEDEEMRNLIIAIFEVNLPDGFFKANELGTTDMRGVHTEEIISWLKSLRPCPSWKPSEEQMKTLNWAANGMMDQCIAAPEMRAVLRELYDDLLKLK